MGTALLPMHSTTHNGKRKRKGLQRVLFGRRGGRHELPDAGMPPEPILDGDAETMDDSLASDQSLSLYERVQSVERILRVVVVLALVYWLGVHQPLWIVWVAKVLEYAVVAWVTCAGLLLWSRFSSSRRPLVLAAEEQLPLLQETSAARSLDVPQTDAALAPFFVMDTVSHQRIHPNQREPFSLDCEYFSGNVMFMLRSPDPAWPFSYFADKQRRFEFQFQIQLKKIPQGTVYFATQLEVPVKLGLVQRAFVAAALAFVKSTNKAFDYSIVGGTDEKPHMAFPVLQGMNRVVVTRSHETPPTLGEEIPETADRQSLEWNLQDTYTFSLWSAYVDFLDWQCLNLPGIRPFGIKSVIGEQAIHLVLYELEGDKHLQSKMVPIVHLEMSNAAHSKLGAHVPVDDPRASAEEDAVAELGQGLYVKSGDSLTLRHGDDLLVTSGGGFCVLQEKTTSTIVIEKVGRRRSAGKSLIRSGDTVRFLLKGPRQETRYLSTHRGWWLKWVSSAPTKNGTFTILTHETEYIDHGREPQSAYLTLGGSFWLKHKRWSKFHVGVAAQGSATYGGRMLGLYLPGGPNELPNDASDDGGGGELELLSDGETNLRTWMQPLHLRACEPFATSIPSPLANHEVEEEPESRLYFARGRHRMDAPAWLEIMNRTERIRQLTFAVRVLPYSEDDDDGFVRLRTGRELSQIMRVGSNWTNSGARRRRGSQDGAELSSPKSREDLAALSPKKGMNKVEFDLALETPRPGDIMRMSSHGSQLERSSSHGIDFHDESVQYGGPNDLRSSTHSFDDMDDAYESRSSDSEWDGVSVEEDLPDEVESRANKPRKLIGKIAKSVKNRTSSTGKAVARKSVNIGKGTVSAGKAIIAPIRPKKPPQKEPKSKSANRGTKKARERDLHVAVSRSMRRMESTQVEAFLAGELSAPEQSCRTVSRMLERMSSISPTSHWSGTFTRLMTGLVENPSGQDSSFLQGGALQLGVVPSSDDASRGPLLSECVVARCLWESHWREEWCGLYQSKLHFYMPLSRSACLEISLSDIDSLRDLDSWEPSPLPGFPILVIETAWLCHYIAFADQDARRNFRTKLDAGVLAASERPDPPTGSLESELEAARFWQGFQSSIEASLSSGKGKWAEIPSGSKMKRRTVLNNRRMLFDLKYPSVFEGDFMEDLLTKCLSFSVDSLRRDPDDLVSFLDQASQLRTLSLRDFDMSSPAAFCFVVNLYHCLLQHALLLSVNGPLHKRSYGHLMRTSCYEIGGDVFSLAEVQCCIIRGRMTRPLNPKPPYIEAPKKSEAYRLYALDFTTPHVNFVLNTADHSCPGKVPVLHPEDLEDQLVATSTDNIRQNLTYDVQKRIITLPKVCEIYRNDFHGDGSATMACLRFCLPYLDDPAVVEKLLQEDPSIKFQAASEQFHSVLRIKEDLFQNS